MKKHVKIYLTAFGYGPEDFIQCECCPKRAVDIHHIDARGMGGDPQGKKDVIENLMALCREHHDEYGDDPELIETLRRIHEKHMVLAGIPLKTTL